MFLNVNITNTFAACRCQDHALEHRLQSLPDGLSLRPVRKKGHLRGRLSTHARYHAERGRSRRHHPDDDGPAVRDASVRVSEVRLPLLHGVHEEVFAVCVLHRPRHMEPDCPGMHERRRVQHSIRHERSVASASAIATTSSRHASRGSRAESQLGNDGDHDGRITAECQRGGSRREFRPTSTEYAGSDTRLQR